MVTFRLLYKTETEIRYEYYPEDDKNSIAGLIEINVAEDSKYYWYASHAINKINKAYEDGHILEEGMAAWY
mgnify:CR=1 FL=1